MIDLHTKHTIIKLYLEDMSMNKIAKTLNLSRITVKKYIVDYENQKKALVKATSEDEKAIIQGRINGTPVYNSSTRSKRKLNDDIIQIVRSCLEENDIRISKGLRKQVYDAKEIWKKVRRAGFDISYSTIKNTVRQLQKASKECFIRQEYDYGESVQFDYGEVKLMINGVLDTYYLAVFSIQKINYRWAYLYNSSNQQTLFDSHNRFIEHIGGVHKEFVYDNMRNIVSRFIGRDKVINIETLKMSNFYQFLIRLTNCRKGNEKGHVEGSVDYIRKCTFTDKLDFDSLIDANAHLEASLKDINNVVSKEELDKEIGALRPSIGVFDYSVQTLSKVNSYGCVTFQNVFYSVPENLVSQTVNIRAYIDYIDIYFNNEKVASHEKSLDSKYCLKIEHFVQTLSKKRGALHNSTALKQLNGRLREVYNSYYTSNPKEFLDLFFLIKNHGLESILKIIAEHMLVSTKIPSYEYISSLLNDRKEEMGVENKSQLQLNSYNAFL